ncbi:hypothetical protein C1646_774818 [Rhizophagus diaphanus]|nr:hypothetical protein C1646_774818 [Rhizophagus diaphanus] [Rhizophagus sp. MUCL 43196]
MDDSIIKTYILHGSFYIARQEFYPIPKRLLEIKKHTESTKTGRTLENDVFAAALSNQSLKSVWSWYYSGQKFEQKINEMKSQYKGKRKGVDLKLTSHLVERSWDFHQILPVIPHGTHSDIVSKLSNILTKEKVLTDTNYAALKNESTFEPLKIIQGIIEDVNKNNENI